MKKNTVIYWVSTGLLGFMMLFSAYNYVANPQMKDAFTHLGFAGYFRYQLAIAKVLGALALLLPVVPLRVKEWAYAGFGITFISAAVAHAASGDPASNTVMPLVFLAVLVISNMYLYKRNKPAVVSFKPAVV